MPSYCYECRSCKSEFTLIARDTDKFDMADVDCVACNDDDVVLMAYSMDEDLTLLSLSAKITDLELRIRELEGDEVCEDS